MNAFHEIAPLIAGSNWHGGGFGWFPFALLWIAVLGTATWLVARAARRGERAGIERAQGVLAERFARGELTGDEYRDRLAELRRQR